MEEEGSAAATWVQDLIRDYQDKLTCGLYDAIYKLDRRSVGTLMRAQARACGAAFIDLADLRGPMPLDQFLERMRISGPSKVEIHREANVILWDEQHDGQCMCPFVRRQVIRLDRRLCICGAQWVKYLFENVANTPVDVDMVSSAATGARNCSFVVRIRE
jgi:predicted hydrocarbon binding protein